MVVGKVMNVNATFDHRFIDGFHAASMSRILPASGSSIRTSTSTSCEFCYAPRAHQTCRALALVVLCLPSLTLHLPIPPNAVAASAWSVPRMGGRASLIGSRSRSPTTSGSARRIGWRGPRGRVGGRDMSALG